MLQRLVQGLRERGVLLAHDDAVLLAGGDLLRDRKVRVGVLALVLHDGQVGDGGLVQARRYAGECGDRVVERDDRGVGQVLLHPGLARSARLDGDGGVCVVKRLGVGADLVGRAPCGDEPLVGVDVRVGEVDLLLALLRDGEVGGAHVGLAALLDGGDDGVELHGVEVLALQPHLLGERLHELDLEALLRLALHVVERRVREVGDNRELALVDEGHLLGLCLLGGAAARRRTASGDAECKHEHEGRHQHDRQPTQSDAVVLLHSYLPFKLPLKSSGATRAAVAVHKRTHPTDPSVEATWRLLPILKLICEYESYIYRNFEYGNVIVKFLSDGSNTLPKKCSKTYKSDRRITQAVALCA